jgi:Carbon storage regulator (could also regulate swarming and quorum sensing)
MLVLSRKEGESFYIGDDICVTVVRTSDEKCRIGIEAPEDVKILRKELFRKKTEKETENLSD